MGNRYEIRIAEIKMSAKDKDEWDALLRAKQEIVNRLRPNQIAVFDNVPVSMDAADEFVHTWDLDPAEHELAKVKEWNASVDKAIAEQTRADQTHADTDVRANTDVRAKRWPWQGKRTTHRSAALAVYTNAQQSDGVGISFMSATERHHGQLEWSAQLRKKVKASDDETKRKERNQVLCDVQWED